MKFLHAMILQKISAHTGYGLMSSLAAWALTVIKITLPYIQYASACVFLSIGVITLYVHVKNIFKGKQD